MYLIIDVVLLIALDSQVRDKLHGKGKRRGDNDASFSSDPAQDFVLPPRQQQQLLLPLPGAGARGPSLPSDTSSITALQQQIGQMQQRQTQFNPNDRVYVEIEGMKQQFGVLEQHVLTEIKARRNAEKAFILPQLDVLNETVVRLEAELMETKQSNKTLQLMIKERDRESLQGAGAIQRSEFDLLKADLRSISNTVKELSVSVAGVAARSPTKQQKGGASYGDAPAAVVGGGGGGGGTGLSASDLAWLQAKVDDAVDEMRSKQAASTESMMQYINGKLYQDLVRRLETTESKVSLDVGAMRMNQEVEIASLQSAISRLRTDVDGDNKVIQSNMNNILSEFNSLRSITRAEVDEALSRLECAEKSWETSVAESLRSIDGDMSKGIGHMQAQHDELKGALAAEITSRRNMDKKHASVIQTFMDKSERESAIFNQDLINLRDQCNTRVLAVENSIAMVASSFASQIASLQESTSAALHVLKKDISSRPVGTVAASAPAPVIAIAPQQNSSPREVVATGLSEEQVVAVVQSEMVKINKRVDELRSRQEAGLYKFSSVITEFTESFAAKFSDLETALQKECAAREADYKRLQVAMSTAMITQSKKTEEESKVLSQKITKSMQLVLELMDTKIGDLEQSIREDYYDMGGGGGGGGEYEDNGDEENNDEDEGHMPAKFKNSNSAASFPFEELGLQRPDHVEEEEHDAAHQYHAHIGHKRGMSGSDRGSKGSLHSRASGRRLRGNGGGSKASLKHTPAESDAGSVVPDNNNHASQSSLPSVQDDYAGEEFANSSSKPVLIQDPSTASFNKDADNATAAIDASPNKANTTLAGSNSAVSINESIPSEIEEDFEGSAASNK